MGFISSLMRSLLLTFLLAPFFHVIAQDYQAIPTRTDVVVDTFFQTYVIEDPYRWLENTDSSTVISWVNRQNEMSGSWLKRIRRTTDSQEKLKRYRWADFNYCSKEGKYYFSMGYIDNRLSPCLLISTSPNEKTRDILINPYNDISKEDKIDIRRFQPSKDSRYLAYQYTRNGSDWYECGVVQLPSGRQMKDHLEGLKFSSIAWKGEGFFYTKYPRGKKFSPTYGSKVYYHKLGQNQEDDKLVFERRKRPWVTFEYLTTSDQRYFVLTETDKIKGRVNVFYIDYQSSHQALRPLVTNYNREIVFLGSHDGKFVAITASKAGNNTVVEVDPANPFQWRELVPPFSEGTLVEAVPFKDKIVALLQANNHPILLVMDYAGKLLHKAEFPMVSSISNIEGGQDEEELQFVLSSYTIPPVVYEFNIETFEKRPVERTGVAFNFEDIKYKEIEYPSFDGTKVPMVLVYKEPLNRNGSNPVLLSAYGGFGVVPQPSFNPGIVHFVKKGGIYAFANIRGGGEKGYEWAHAGKGVNKENSFADFIAAAEFLIDKKYTKPERLAATGASNGGLVVATSAIQRPGLFKAVVPVVAPTDMLRFEKFTVGPWHRDEYGTVLDSAGFTRLRHYSPYHNIKKGVDYPSMLVVSSENDDRVPPLHSYKFVARLQNREAQKNPILLKVEEGAGHYGASALRFKTREIADKFSFVIHELNMD